MNNRRPLKALTGIRFFLAIWVVIYHQGPWLTESLSSTPAIHRIAECFIFTGYSAVSAFFILSGFVLTYNYDLPVLAAPRNALRFGIARFSRIYPSYVAGILGFVPLAF